MRLYIHFFRSGVVAWHQHATYPNLGYWSWLSQDGAK